MFVSKSFNFCLNTVYTVELNHIRNWILNRPLCSINTGLCAYNIVVLRRLTKNCILFWQLLLTLSSNHSQPPGQIHKTVDSVTWYCGNCFMSHPHPISLHVAAAGIFCDKVATELRGLKDDSQVVRLWSDSAPQGHQILNLMALRFQFQEKYVWYVSAVF